MIEASPNPQEGGDAAVGDGVGDGVGVPVGDGVTAGLRVRRPRSLAQGTALQATQIRKATDTMFQGSLIYNIAWQSKSF